MARVVLIAGGYRTGSTLQYNLLGQYLEHAGLGRRIGYVLPDDAESAVAALATADGLAVAKCHQIAPGFHDYRTPDAWGRLVERGTAVAVLTHRDPAGVERSMCRKFSLTPEGLHSSTFWLENEANLARWRPIAAFDQDYTDLTERPRRALVALLRTLGVPVRWRSVLHAASATRARKMAEHQRTVEPGTWDPVTLVHWDHIADG
jgi:hypothetical protein